MSGGVKEIMLISIFSFFFCIEYRIVDELGFKDVCVCCFWVVGRERLNVKYIVLIVMGDFVNKVGSRERWKAILGKVGSEV